MSLDDVKLNPSARSPIKYRSVYTRLVGITLGICIVQLIFLSYATSLCPMQPVSVLCNLYATSLCPLQPLFVLCNLSLSYATSMQPLSVLCNLSLSYATSLSLQLLTFASKILAKATRFISI